MSSRCVTRAPNAEVSPSLEVREARAEIVGLPERDGAAPDGPRQRRGTVPRCGIGHALLHSGIERLATRCEEAVDDRVRCSQLVARRRSLGVRRSFAPIPGGSSRTAIWLVAMRTRPVIPTEPRAASAAGAVSCVVSLHVGLQFRRAVARGFPESAGGTTVQPAVVVEGAAADCTLLRRSERARWWTSEEFGGTGRAPDLPLCVASYVVCALGCCVPASHASGSMPFARSRSACAGAVLGSGQSPVPGDLAGQVQDVDEVQRAVAREGYVRHLPRRCRALPRRAAVASWSRVDRSASGSTNVRHRRTRTGSASSP